MKVLSLIATLTLSLTGLAEVFSPNSNFYGPAQVSDLAPVTHLEHLPLNTFLVAKHDILNGWNNNSDAIQYSHEGMDCYLVLSTYQSGDTILPGYQGEQGDLDISDAGVLEVETIQAIRPITQTCLQDITDQDCQENYITEFEPSEIKIMFKPKRNQRLPRYLYCKADFNSLRNQIGSFNSSQHRNPVRYLFEPFEITSSNFLRSTNGITVPVTSQRVMTPCFEDPDYMIHTDCDELRGYDYRNRLVWNHRLQFYGAPTEVFNVQKFIETISEDFDFAVRKRAAE